MDINILQRNLAAPLNIKVSYPRDRNRLIITWDEVRNPDKNISDKQINKIFYNIYKSYSQNGIYYLLNEHPIQNNRYEDFESNNNPNLQQWYKISTVYETLDGYIESMTSAPTCYKVHNTDKWFAKMNERNYWILENVGVQCDLYTRKYTGERCPHCYDELRGRGGNQNCPVCYGTGFIGGYDPTTRLYIRFKPVQTQLDIGTPMMYTYQNMMGAWTISDIKIANRDIIINPEGKIFQVLNNAINHAAGMLFHQELNLKEFDPEDVIYNMKRVQLYPK